MLSPSMANKLYILEVEMLKLTVFLYLLSIERTSLSVPHCVHINLQWGTVLFDGSVTEKEITLPISFYNILGFSTFAYGQGVHSVFGGFHTPPNAISMYRKAFFAEDVNCIWFGVFK